MGGSGSAGSPNAFLLRRRLRRELSQARIARRLTQAEAAAELGVSLSTLIRAELGETAIPAKDVAAYAVLYGLADRVQELQELARSSRRLPWREYQQFVSPVALEFFAYEASASAVRSFTSAVLPGLLQTPEYTTYLLFECLDAPRSVVERHVAIRAERQRYAFAGEAELHFVLDEAVLRRRVGGADLMSRQLKHIVDIAEEGSATIQVLPFSRDVGFALRGGFVLLEFDHDEDPDIVYLESAVGDRVIFSDSKIIKGVDDVTRAYRRGFDEMSRAATEPDGFRKTLYEFGILLPEPHH